MISQRRKHTQEFKEQVIKEAIETGNTALVARQYNLAPNMLYRWIREYQNPKSNENHQPAVQQTTVNSSVVKSLETENTTLKKLLGEKDLQIAILEDLLKKINRR
jgi:transposase